MFQNHITGLLVIVVLAAANSCWADEPVSFVNDIQPILTKLGCNQGACHGAQYGQGGFKLSLRAFDDSADYIELVRGAYGRRVKASNVAESLLLTKPLMEIPHGGGRRLNQDSWAHQTLVRWMQQKCTRTVAERSQAEACGAHSSGGDLAARADGTACSEGGLRGRL